METKDVDTVPFFSEFGSAGLYRHLHTDATSRNPVLTHQTADELTDESQRRILRRQRSLVLELQFLSL